MIIFKSSLFRCLPFLPFTSFSSFMSPMDEVIDIGEKKKSFGSLIIIPTPIGNLRDLSIRQYENLLSVDIIACEDTRKTGLLLTMIKKKHLKGEFEEKFGVNLADFKAEDQTDSPLPPSPPENEDEIFREIAKSKFADDSIDSLTARKKLMEELRIKTLKEKAKKILDGTDSLSFLNKYDEFDGGAENSDIYGLEDDFISYLRKRVEETRNKKGRGILLSYYKENEMLRIPKLIKSLKYGFKVGLVSDAGTPTISDPGYKLINECIKQNITIESLPGPNIVTVALTLSGFPSDSYVFEGFLPKIMKERTKRLEKIKESGKTTVLLEGVERLSRLLISMEKIFGGEQEIWLGMEITKLFEKTLRKKIKELIADINEGKIVIKGEAVLVIPPLIQKKKEDEENKNKKDDGEDDDLISKLKSQEKFKENINSGHKNEGEPEGGIHKINELNMVRLMEDRLEISDKDLSDMVGSILGISKNRSMGLVKRIKEEKMGKKESPLESFERNVLKKKKKI